MKIAMVSTSYESVPPRGYGGTERVVSLLTEGLVKRGHDVTLFATGDSLTSAKLVSFVASPCKPYDPNIELVHAFRSLKSIQELGYDVIHNHSDLCTRLLANTRIPSVTTLHNNALIGHDFPAGHFVAVSRNQFHYAAQSRLRTLKYVYNAVDVRSFDYKHEPGSYLAFLGRISRFKGCHSAIAVSLRTGLPLKIAGKVPMEDQSYFRREIAPHLNSPQIEFVGELNEVEKMNFLKNAFATLVPIEWEEPFGLVMIESMACGTPVVAFNRGSAPEIVDHGRTGWIVNGLDEMVSAVQLLGEIQRNQCRSHVQQKFNVDTMVKGYEVVYQTLAR